MSVNINNINKKLKENYGCNLSGQPIFRVVFSDDQREKRFGKYAEYYGKIFLREFNGLKEVPKYPYLQHLWILERWMPPTLSHTIEIPETVAGSYEPVYVFQDAQGKGLPVVERVIHKIIYGLFHIELPGHVASLQKTEEEEAIRKEIAETVLELEEQGRTWIGHRLHSKEAIVRP